MVFVTLIDIAHAPLITIPYKNWYNLFIESAKIMGHLTEYIVKVPRADDVIQYLAIQPYHRKGFHSNVRATWPMESRTHH